jgi:glucan 1,3-beta-glucosidase
LWERVRERGIMNYQKLQGVNLGGWLLLEKWMTPKLFEGLNAQDEYSFCLDLGKKEAKKRLEKHWQSFITKKDFTWIKKNGLNAVRIPVGYWNFEEDSPFISSNKYFEQALIWAKEADLQVIIDLHGAPGSQNGWDHSGRSGEIAWHKDNQNIEKTLKVLEKIAKKYGNKKHVVGIELLNEPHWDIPLNQLQDFYKKGYELIRANCPERVSVIMHDSFKPHDWQRFFTKNNFTNVILDCHLYQCFDEKEKKLDIYGHLQKTAIEWKNLIESLQTFVPVIIGEWSAELVSESLQGLNQTQLMLSKKVYVETELLVFENSAGWFFWNYKVDNNDMKLSWSYKDLVNDKIFPKV